MAALNTPAPSFSLCDLAGVAHNLGEYLGRIVMLYFWSATCPWVVRADREIAKWPAELTAQAVILRVAMNADEPVDDIRRQAASRVQGILLLDPDRKTTDAYGALVTPEFFLLDRGGIIRYRGAFDDATFRQPAPTRPYAETALRTLLAGGNPDPAETPAYGCAIVRWKI
jgi:peroxiredoxin